MITDYIGGEGSAKTPKNDYVIYGWPLKEEYVTTFTVRREEDSACYFVKLGAAIISRWCGIAQVWKLLRIKPSPPPPGPLAHICQMSIVLKNLNLSHLPPPHLSPSKASGGLAAGLDWLWRGGEGVWSGKPDHRYSALGGDRCHTDGLSGEPTTETVGLVALWQMFCKTWVGKYRR